MDRSRTRRVRDLICRFEIEEKIGAVPYEEYQLGRQVVGKRPAYPIGHQRFKLNNSNEPRFDRFQDSGYAGFVFVAVGGSDEAAVIADLRSIDVLDSISCIAEL